MKKNIYVNFHSPCRDDKITFILFIYLLCGDNENPFGKSK